MSWFWTSKKPTPPSSPGPENQQSSPTLSDSPDPSPSTQHQPTRDDLAAAELRAFLESLQEQQPSPSSSQQPLSSFPPDSIHPVALLPTTLSCRAAFDSAFYCQSLGGQFTAVYRYGTLRNCSDAWADFWFCMRTNRGALDEEERRERIRKRAWEKEKKYREGRSSEDVWGLRGVRVGKGTFEGDLEAVERRERESKEG